MAMAAAVLALVLLRIAPTVAIAVPPKGQAQGPNPAKRLARTATAHHAAPAAKVATTVLNVATTAPEGETLHAEIWYPATSRGGTLVPHRRAEPRPLIVFSQGFDLPVATYSDLLRHWAASGFVVAAPAYPYTAPPGPLDEADIVNHPAELRSVISAVVGAARRPGSALSGLVNADEVGLAGHSDGGDVSLAVADNTCCRDPAVKAVAVLSGAELSSFGGTYFAGPQVPLLVVQGSDDPVNVPACSAQIYDQARGTRYYLDLLGANHYDPYVSNEAAGTPLAGRYRSVVANVTTDFFEATLENNHGALTALERAGTVPGVASLVAGGAAPVAPGWCEGAPH